MKFTFYSGKITVSKNVPVLKTEVEYGASSDNDTEPTSWSEDRPDTQSGEILWQRFKVTYNDGTIEYLTPSPISGEKGDPGEAYTTVIESSNGNVFRPTSISTTLSCRVYFGTKEITDTLEDYRFNWKRNTGNTDSDNSWNNSSKAIGKKSIDVTTEDCIGRTVFDCIVDIGE